jgi:hypothetical protein
MDKTSHARELPSGRTEEYGGYLAVELHLIVSASKLILEL